MERRAPIFFVTGTDTGAGKTVLTALLLHHWRRRGIRALAMKPFATGPPDDARLLDRLQEGALPMPLLSSFRFRAPLAPLVAARRERRTVPLAEAVAAIGQLQTRCERLLVEGCGGLLTPLGPGYTARELIAELGCATVICARNRLGVLNQVLLAVEVLRANRTPPDVVVLLGQRGSDPSVPSNAAALRKLASPTPVLELPWLGRLASPRAIATAARRCRLRLNQLTDRLDLPALA